MLERIVRWSLVAALLYSFHVAHFDCDKRSFENRLLEGIKFVEQNVDIYRVLMHSTVRPDIIDTPYQIPERNFKVFRTLAPVVISIYGLVGSFAATLVFLKSRMGCLLTGIHVLGTLILLNAYYLRPIIKQLFANEDRDDLLRFLTP